MMNNAFSMDDHLPLIAILRGVSPNNAIRVAGILIDEGFTMIEVPLNSPDALTSIRYLVEHFGERYCIGAGTVSTPELAMHVIATGAKLMVTPNFNLTVVQRATEAGCAVFPGVITPTEAFNALAAGATGLKLFPISCLGLEGFKALRSVLPEETLCFPVGGIGPTVACMQPYVQLGAKGFGLGSALFKPEMADALIRTQARAFIDAFNACFTETTQ